MHSVYCVEQKYLPFLILFNETFILKREARGMSVMYKKYHKSVHLLLVIVNVFLPNL